LGASAGSARPSELTITPGWSFAVPDWKERLYACTSLMPALPLDAGEVARAIALFNLLRLPDVEGQPLLQSACGDWVREIVGAIFGSLIEGRRMVRDAFILVPKKNAKSTLAAAIMLVALMVNRRPNARFALFGPTQEIADIAFDAAANMIRADEDLTKLFHVKEHFKEITYRLTNASLSVTTFDMKIATGGKLSGWLLDEAHLLGSVAYAERVVEQLRGARVAIAEQFGIIITTQSDVPPAGFFKKELAYARAVRDGKIEAAGYLPLLYEFPLEIQADKEKPWLDVGLWPLVNPNLGRSASVESISDRYREASEKGAENLLTWASQYLNIEIGVGLHADRWSGAEHWQGAVEPAISLDWLIENCEVITVGVDGGGLDDLLGFALIGRQRGTNRWFHWGKAWCDRGVLALRKEIAPALEGFERDGDLVIIDMGETEDGPNADVREIRDIVERVHTAGLLPEKAGIGLDAVGVAAIWDELNCIEPPLPEGCMVSVPQGYKLSGVIKGAARKLKDGTLKHAGQPLMAFSVGNAKQEKRGSADLITKQVSGSTKIDPLVALFNAFELMSRNPVAKGSSVYQSRGVLVI
jgi:phage terminase large subunit-like protein